MFNTDCVIICNSLDEAEDCLNKIEEYFGYAIYKPSEENKKNFIEDRALFVFYDFVFDTTCKYFMYKNFLFIEGDKIFINYKDFLELCKEPRTNLKEKDIITDKTGRIIRVNRGDKNMVFYTISKNEVRYLPVQSVFEKQEIAKKYICYISKEACEKALKRQEIHRKLEDLAFELNGNRDITEEEWNNHFIKKYYLYYIMSDNSINSTFNLESKNQGTIFCLNKDFEDKAIELIGEEDLKDYLINY